MAAATRRRRRGSPAALLAKQRQAARRDALREAQQHIQSTLLHAQRRLEAAADTRFGGDRWGSADAENLQTDLASDLDEIRRRCRFEIQNNGIVKGLVKSFADDIVGKDGPKLVLMSEDKEWVKSAEAMWSQWWAQPDINARLSGPELLSLGARGLWADGEWFWNMVKDDTLSERAIQTRLHALPARHIDTPYDQLGLAATGKGVEVSDTGKVLRYHANRYHPTTGMPNGSSQIAAENMVHFFIPEEPDQYRGCPLLAASLQVIGQLRDYDREVMEAARMAAMLALLITQPSDPNADPVVLNPSGGSWELEHGMAVPLPPGCEAKQVNPQQPMRIYKEFRNEKLMEIGRSVCMPLMIVRLDSSGHNYSSARFDGQSYDRSLAAIQGQMERMALNRTLATVMREAWLAGIIRPPPADMTLSWIWPKRPHVDPVKEKSAAILRMLDGTSSQSDECSEIGKDPDVVRAQRRKEGLPEGPIALNGVTLDTILAIAAAESEGNPAAEPAESTKS